MRLINIKTYKLEEFLEKPPAYAILSHTWGHESEELTLRDVEEGRIHKPGVGLAKFLGTCQQAAKDGLGYVWIDTCCIDKTNLVELSEAINSMFRWYGCASICYAYLSDVPAGDVPEKPDSKFRSSRWFRRGWTLQELLAPRHVRFYDSKWDVLGTKASARLRLVIREITGIPSQILRDSSEVRNASVAQRMSWAAGRETKRKEDIAYCLLGIFGVSMPMIYGEGGEQAFLRLQEQIMKKERDDSILAWGLPCPEEIPVDNSDKPGQVVAGKVLATSPSHFAYSGHIIHRLHERSATRLDALDIVGGSLRISLPLLITPSGRTIGLLNCGPQHDARRVVGIPLAQAVSGTLDEYIRPEGLHAVLQDTTTSKATYKVIYIRNDVLVKKSEDPWQHYWVDDAFYEAGLELIDIYPLSCGDKDRSVLMAPIMSSDDTPFQILARFRYGEQECPDFVILLETNQPDTSAKPQCHVMICNRDTPLQELANRLQDVVQKVSGRDRASNGLLHIHVSLESDVQRSIFYIKPEILSHPPDVTVNISPYLRMQDSLLELLEAWETKKKNEAEMKDLNDLVNNKTSRLKQIEREQEIITSEVRKLESRRKVLAEEEKRETQELNLLRKRRATVEGGYNEVSSRWQYARKHWNELWGLDNKTHGLGSGEESDWVPIYWASERGYTDIVEVLLAKGTDPMVIKEDGWTPLTVASSKGYIDIVQLLSNHGADVTFRDIFGRTALWYAYQGRHEAVVQLLLEAGTIPKEVNSPSSIYWASERGYADIVEVLLGTGADPTVRNTLGWTPLIVASRKGYVDVVRLLINHGVDITTQDNMGNTALWHAFLKKREDVVQLLLGQSTIIRSGRVLCWKRSGQTFCSGLITALAVSPDSKLLAAGMSSGHIKLWALEPRGDAFDITERNLECIDDDSSRSTTSVAFAQDSAVVAFGFSDGILLLMDTTTGKLLGIIHDYAGFVTSARSSAILAWVSTNNNIQLWDMETKDITRVLSPPNIVCSLAFANSAMLASGLRGESTIWLWDTTTGRRLHTLKDHEYDRDIYCLAFAPSLRTLASVSRDTSVVRFWNIVTGQLQQSIDLCETVTSIAFAPNSIILAVTSGNTIQLWDTSIGDILCRIEDDHPVHFVSLAHNTLKPQLPMLIYGSSNYLDTWQLVMGPGTQPPHESQHHDKPLVRYPA